MNIIMVTGAKGFLGSAVCKELAWRDYHFVSIKHGTPNTIHTETELLNHDVTLDLMRYHKPDCIIHTAGRVGGIGLNQTNPADLMTQNLYMGMNVLDCAEKVGIKRVIMIGTVCAYPEETPVPFKEECLWDGYPEPTNAAYGIAKRTLMEMASVYNEQYGMDNISLIPTNLYGPGDNFHPATSHVIPALILKFHNAIKSNESAVEIWGSGKATRDFLYVDECAKGIIAAMERYHSNEPLNLSSGDQFNIEDLAYMIRRLMGYKGRLYFNTNKPDGQMKRCVCCSKALRQTGWWNTKKLEDGLNRTIQWFKESRMKTCK
jgi:GDP-L-fucose synthase